MNKQQLSNFVNFLLAVFFILKLVTFILYVPCELYVDLIKKNSLVFKLDWISWLALTLGGFLVSSGSNRGVFRVILVAVSYSTLNEITGLNNYVTYLEYPIFWILIIITGIYSYFKYEKS